MMSFLLAMLAAAPVEVRPEHSWKQTEHSLALLRSGKVIWQFNYEKEGGKPCFHPVTVAGSDALTDLRPPDHPWHRAIWFSWKFINGVNYWEENPKTGRADGETELVEVRAMPREDHSARFEMALRYHPPEKPPVLSERRIVEVSRPAEDGKYCIDWLGTFTAADGDVLLDRTPILGEPKGVSYGGYAGLSLRLAPSLREWEFADREGPVHAAWKQAPWMSFRGPTRDGRSAAIVVLDHPANLRHPAPWYLIQKMPYFSPALLYRGPYTLPAGRSITLRYRILLLPGPLNREAVESDARRFGETK